MACAAGHYVQQGKPSVAYVRSSSGNIAFCLKTDTNVVTLTFDPKINELPGFFVKHLCVK